MLSLRRARPYALVFAAVAAVVGLVAAALLLLLGRLDVTADAGSRESLTLRAGADLALAARLPLAPDPVAQDDTVREVIGAAVPDSVNASVTSSVWAEMPFGPPIDEQDALVVTTDGLAGAARIVTGREAATPDEASMQADAAARLGLGPGAEVTLGGRTVVIVGTWLVDDPQAPEWLGDERMTRGAGPEIGPFALDDPDWGTFADARPRVQWVAVPASEDVTVGGLEEILRSWPLLRSRLAAAGVPTDGLSTPGAFTGTAQAVTADVERMRAITPVAVVLLLAATVITLVELARYLTARRITEHALLWARGRSALAAARAGAVEGGVAAAGGAILGALVAAAVTAALPSVFGSIASPAVAASAACVLVVITAAAHAVCAARASGPPMRTVARGRLRRAISPAATLVVALAAGIAVWQLRLYGSPVIRDANGAPGVDPVAAAAPALALVAGVLLLLLALPLVARSVERGAGRRRVTNLLATRAVARAPSQLAAVVAVLAVATGTVVTAAAYTRTWDVAFTQTSAVRAGAPVQVVAGRGGFTPDDVDRVARAPGVSAVFPVQGAPLQLSDGSGALVAADVSALDAVPAAAMTLVDPAELMAAVRVDPGGPEVPVGVQEIRMTTTVSGLTAAPAFDLVLLDDHGVLRRIPGSVDAAAVDGGAEGTVVATFPVGSSATDAARHVVALDVAFGEDAVVGDEARVGPPTFVAGPSGSPPLFAETEWAARVGDILVPPDPQPDGGFLARPGVTDVRVAPVEEPAGLAEPPVAISDALAEQYGLTVGDRLSFGIERVARYTGVVTAIAPAIPSAAEPVALLVDLTVLQLDALRAPRGVVAPSSLWVDADDPQAAALAIREVVAPGAGIVTADPAATRRIVGASVVVLWTVAAVTALLAVATMVAVAGGVRRSRRSELATLRALGLGASAQGSIRAQEWLLVIGAGVAVGLAAGAAVALLTIPELARAAVPDDALGRGMALLVDGRTGTVAILLLIGASLGVTLGAVARTRRDARSPGRAEDVG
ncbi:hypothetical protein [Microbacterium invictum]|uniref:ABC3 transporter permease protein domain-containing protein n=1 Tax=Microbacterium invictum TaxID=515415 RepID=A0ABZ0VC05_9MICO|nr:hypothetical protein [Microbacterium invictum]WQB70764.1 hypothetical protein T9R20_02050 [Microbacterium invictum]